MGNHYIPRYYLKGFTESPKSKYIWVYNKDSKKHFRSNINNIAQQNRYFTQATETYLADVIEDPANKVLDKLRSEEKYSLEDKWTLAKYMSVLLKRVPNTRELFKKWYEDISKSFPKLKEAKITATEQFIWEQILPPGMTPDICLVLYKMKWDILVFDKRPIFITCDNPIYYPTHSGLGDKDSEVIFPLSTNIALFASWDKRDFDEYKTIDEDMAIEINQRTTYVSTRYLYYSEKLSMVKGIDEIN